MKASTLSRRRTLGRLAATAGLAAGLAGTLAHSPARASTPAGDAGRAATPAPSTTQPRVISLGGSITEIVFRLGAGPALVATDTTSLFPEQARTLPKVGYPRALSAEGVLSLRPALVLAGPEAGPAAAIAQLQAAGVKLVRAETGHSFASLLATVRLIGDALDRRSESERLAESLQQHWLAARAQIDAGLQAGGRRVRTLFVLSHTTSSVQVAGARTAAQAVIELAGGVNAMSGFDGYRPLSAEAVIAAAPEVILTSAQGIEALGGPQALLARPGLSLTPAGRAKRVVAFDALYLLGFGPRLPQVVAELAQRLRSA